MKSTLTRLILFALLALPGLARAQSVEQETEGSMRVVKVADPAAAAKPATAGVIERLDQIPDDFWTQAGIGDFLLANDFAGFTIGSIPEGNRNQARQGNVLDAYASPADPESFQVFQPSLLIDYTKSLMASDIKTENDEKTGSARIVVTGEDMTLKGVTFETIYRLDKGWPGMLVRTTVRNTTDAEITVPVFADHVGWGAMGVFIPSRGWTGGGVVVENTEFAFGRFYDGFVMVAPREGLMETRFGTRESLQVYKRDIKLLPGQVEYYDRWLVTGLDDPSKLFSFVLTQRGSSTYGYLAGIVQERVLLDDGSFHEAGPVANAEIRISTVVRDDLPEKQYQATPYMLGRTDANGRYQMQLPAGQYQVDAADQARVFEPSRLAVHIKNGRASGTDHGLSRAASVIFELIDGETGKAVPGKVNLLPLRGTRPIEIGKLGSLYSVNSIYVPNGRAIADIPPGNYRAVASHGTEYHTTEQRITVQPIETQTVRFEMRRAYDPKGWISADVAVLTNRSPHSRISPEERIASAISEGLDWIVSADSGPDPTDLQPIIERLGVADLIRASRGFHLSGGASGKLGDFLLFPITLCSAGSAVDFSPIINAETTYKAVELMRAICPSAVLVAHRPIFPTVGYLSQEGYDYGTGKFPEGDVLMDFDAFQVWEGKRQSIIGQAFAAYNELLTRGAKVAAIGYSLSAGTWNEEPGYPRIYIPSSSDDPREFNEEEFARKIKQGVVQITNGPFIELTVNGQPMGSMVTDTDGTVDVDLKVYAPNWSAISGVTIQLNGRFVRKFILPAGSVDMEAGMVYPPAKRPEDGKFKLTVEKDSILTVLIEGDAGLPQDPVNPLLVPTTDSRTAQGQVTMAISAPIYIDVDGNGVLDLDMATETAVETVPAF